MSSEMFSRYLAVTDADSQPWLVAQSIAFPDHIYHWGGYSYMCIDKRIRILKEYIIRDSDGYLDGDACELQFHRDFPPIPVTFDGTGWLSPEGKFYSCSYSGHDNLAVKLNAVVFGSIKGSTSAMEKAGWIRFSRGRGATYSLDKAPTQEQINVVVDYLNAGHTDEEVIKHMKHTLENMLELVEDTN